jgi:hypothetical protein
MVPEFGTCSENDSAALFAALLHEARSPASAAVKMLENIAVCSVRTVKF